jgi:phosphatidylinositol 4-kinase
MASVVFLLLNFNRVKNSSDSQSFQYIFSYLEDATIQKDKAGLWVCIVYIAQKIFNIYLEVMSAQPKTLARDRDLERQVQFLLVKFNHINEKLRKLADILLAKLMERFPNLLWSEKTLRCIMDIIELLSASLNMDVNQVAPEFTVPNTSYKLKVLDTLSGREAMIRDFIARCGNILQEALKFAPITTKSHIQNYMLHLQQNGTDVYNHYGVNMILETVMQFSKPKSDTEYLDVRTAKHLET